MSHATDWHCSACRFVLGQVRDGVLRPLAPVESVDGRGLARVSCPRCGRVRVWFPNTASSADGCPLAYQGGRGADGRAASGS